MPLRRSALARSDCGIPVEAELEGVGAGGVGADPQGVEEAGRVAEAGGMATEVDARAEGASRAAPFSIDGRRRREVDGGRRVRSDCELDGGGGGAGGAGEEDGDEEEGDEDTMQRRRRHGDGGEFGDFVGGRNY